MDLAYVMRLSLNEIKGYAQNRHPQKSADLFKKQIKVVDEEINKLHQLKDIMMLYIKSSIGLYKNKSIKIFHLNAFRLSLFNICVI